jgi:TonB family protein
MSTVTAILQPALPWTRAEEDRRFRRILVQSLLFFFLIAGIVPWLQVSRVETVQDITPPPRLARVIEEAVSLGKPAGGESKPAVQSMPVPPQSGQQAVTAARASADRKQQPETPRKLARQSGILAMSERLAELSQAMPRITAAGPGPRQDSSDGPGPAQPAGAQSSRLTAGITRGSGGIGDVTLSNNTLLGATDLRAIAAAGAGGSGGTGGSGGEGRVGSGSGGSSDLQSGSSRSREEIQEILERNKQAIYNLYNNALRNDPELEGHMLMSITIAPSGQVTACSILFSELKAASLEAQLVQLIRRIDFGAKPDARVVTTKVPIEFFPI